ncbi:MAG: hypothetical protein NZ853_01145 [Leptospiraceae bacterium]|nr:hypothetical protein [Leptospiraceae bacterium]MDW7976165.1 hypothetical protein [Leptospiraceae bacterium]
MISQAVGSDIEALKEIQEVLHKELSLLQKATQIEKEKGSAILSAKAQKLQELTQKSNEFLHSLIEIENQRYTLIGNLISKYKDKISSSQLNISNFMKVIAIVKENSNPRESNQLIEIIDGLIEILTRFRKQTEELKAEVEANQKLLHRTKKIVSEFLDEVEKKDKTYLRSNKVKVSSSVLINQSI